MPMPSPMIMTMLPHEQRCSGAQWSFENVSLAHSLLPLLALAIAPANVHPTPATIEVEMGQRAINHGGIGRSSRLGSVAERRSRKAKVGCSPARHH
ncbi:hypothetical protein BCR44DRAFT_1432788 [Catenaria anguillulae PL171]|uniref:Uncharacterized protein n=1 Tax=Catenaria anguillulae PL171 TaxID=765915 RepID=A0A1Y2HQM0_9FUNG|nr:hypothetical protein BCR44DRAFT_1432788 [Catenaria anguillulae PL171]